MSDYTYDYGNAPEAPRNGKGAVAGDVIQFPANVPVSLALKYAKPRRIETKRGTRWLATTVHGPVAFFDTETALQIEKLEPKPGEIFWVCFKKTSKSDLGHYDVWLDSSTERVRGSETTTDLERTLQASIDRVNAAKAKKASPREEMVDRTPAPIEEMPETTVTSHATPKPARTQLEAALETAVAACYRAQQYAREIGYREMPYFSSDDISKMAMTLIIGKREGNHAA
jgi:hypothetical protein